MLKKQCFIACLILYTSLVAAEIYRYQDENGRWHFSDQKPEEEAINSEVEQVDVDKRTNTLSLETEAFADIIINEDLCVADTQRRSVYYEPTGGYLGQDGNFELKNTAQQPSNPSIMAINNYFAPVEVLFRLTENRGMRASKPLPATVLVAPHSRQKVVDLSPVSESSRWSYRYTYTHQLGDSKARHDSNCWYLPPVPPGGQYRITQAFNGGFSHNSPYNRYAVDIALPEGTPIHASRDGIVIRRITEFVLAGLSERFKSRANSLSILHGDGTISIYAHLQFRSIRVHEGMRVKAGDVIAKSGNTGYSTGPHLHFEVVKNQNFNWYSLPFKYYVDGKPQTPRVGMLLSNEQRTPDGQ